MSMSIPRILPIALTVIGSVALQAADGLDQSLSINSWRDRPSEFFAEINTRLAPADRLAWHASGAVDAIVYPGVTLEQTNSSLGAVIDAYCQANGLDWATADGLAWIHLPEQPAVVADAVAQLGSDDAATRAAAADTLALADHPVAIRSLLTAWADAIAAGNDEVAADARVGLGLCLGVGRATIASPFHLAYALWGHPDRSRWRQNPLGALDEWDMTSSWVAVRLALADERSQQQLDTILTKHPKLTADLIAMSLGALQGRPAVVGALKTWAHDPFDTGVWGAGGWQQRYIAGRARGLLRTYFPDSDAPELKGQKAKDDKKKKKGKKDQGDQAEADPVHPATAILQRVRESNLIATYEELRNAERTWTAAVKGAQARNDPIAMKELRKEKNELDRRQGNTNKELEEQMKQIGKLAEMDTDSETIAALVALITDREQVYDLLRGAAAQAAEAHRAEALAPALADCLLNDDQPRAQRHAAVSLGAQRHAGGIAKLHEALQQEASVGLRKHAIRGLARSRYPEAGDWVLTRLEAAKPEERQFILQFLALFRHPPANKLLIQLAQNEQASKPDRLSAAVALGRVPTEAAEEVLTSLLGVDSDPALKKQILQSLIPRDPADIENNAPILLQVAARDRDEEVLKIAIEGLQLCARALGPGHPIKQQVADLSLTIIKDRTQANNTRRLALNSFKYTDVDEALLAEMEAVRDGEKNPIMRKFASIACTQVKKRLATDEEDGSEKE